MDNTPECGVTLEQLSEHLQTDAPSTTGSPAAGLESHIRQCPQCRHRVAALQQLNGFTKELITHETEEAGGPDTSWLEEMLSNLNLETKAGRSIPLASSRESDALSQTEGSVIALIRSAGDAVAGIAIGRCRLVGDVTVLGELITINITVTAIWGHTITETTRSLRSAVAQALATHTELNIEGINITVNDITGGVEQKEDDYVSAGH
ncbi:Asp23/Gls24 family envelope stress response protein [Pseudarthrobacter sp. J1738]